MDIRLKYYAQNYFPPQKNFNNFSCDAQDRSSAKHTRMKQTNKEEKNHEKKKNKHKRDRNNNRNDNRDATVTNDNT